MRSIGKCCSKGKRWRWCCIIGWRPVGRGDCGAAVGDEPAVGAGRRRRSSEMGRAASRWRRRVQLPVGIGLLLSLPGELQNPLLGDDWVSTLLFGASLVMALGLMHHLSMIALGDLRRGAVVRTAVLMIATILLMAATFQHARHRAERSIATARNGRHGTERRPFPTAPRMTWTVGNALRGVPRSDLP